jgi:predicted nucleic acid-binding protein
MANLQIRNVPDDIHRRLKGRAALEGRSLSEYALQELVRALERPTRQALEDLGDLDLVRHPHDVLLPMIWRLRENMIAYDGAYGVLAEALDAPLLTLDARLAAAPGHTAHIEVIA